MTAKYYVLENLDTAETELIARAFPFTGDLLKDSDNFSCELSFSFNLWSDKYQTDLLATSEI